MFELTPRYRKILQWSFLLLMAKVLIEILHEYRLYFPADFDSAFLSGRRYTFFGVYRSAFYVHIVAGPFAIVLAWFLLMSGHRQRAGQASVKQLRRIGRLHRIGGRVQAFVVLLLLTPSGLVMAAEAYGGPASAAGFACLSILTAVSMCLTIAFAWAGKYAVHQRWAMRCAVLLISPLLLRVVGGILVVTQCESEWTYQANAWLSWILPIVALEAWWKLSVPQRQSGPPWPSTVTT